MKCKFGIGSGRGCLEVHGKVELCWQRSVKYNSASSYTQYSQFTIIMSRNFHLSNFHRKQPFQLHQSQKPINLGTLHSSYTTLPPHYSLQNPLPPPHSNPYPSTLTTNSGHFPLRTAFNHEENSSKVARQLEVFRLEEIIVAERQEEI